MENEIDMKTNGSNAWPYVIAGSAIGGALGYLLWTDSGRKIRRAMTNPDELADELDGARNFIERKAKMVTDHVHGIIDKAEQSIEEGQNTYREAGQQYRSRARQIEYKNTEVTSSVHRAVDNVNRTAVTIEQSVLDPICEMGALYRGIERGIRSLFGKAGRRTVQDRTVQMGPVPIHRD